MWMVGGGQCHESEGGAVNGETREGSDIQSHHWHCHKAEKVEANLSVLCILPQWISDGVEVVLWWCLWRKFWEEKIAPVLISRAYICNIRY